MGSYATHLVADWLPALDGVVEKLRAGASVADVGCGQGGSTVLMAQAFERSTFAGFDPSQSAVEAARKAAAQAGVATRTRFTVAAATDLPGVGFDLVCLLDPGDLLGAARCIRRALAPDGTFLVAGGAADVLREAGFSYVRATTDLILEARP